MAKFALAAVVVLLGAYGIGQTGLPGQALVFAMDWLTTNGYLAMNGMIAETAMAAL